MGTFIGCVGLHSCNPAAPSFEIGYCCHNHHVGWSYTSKAVRALTTFTPDQLGAQRIEIRCDTRNTASRRVAEKCRYSLEATLHHNARDPRGNLRDTHILTHFLVSAQ